MRRLTTALLVGLAACGGREASHDSAATTRAAGPAPEPTAAVSITQEREADLTADGTPELLRVAARGPRPESLTVVLTISDRAGSVEQFRDEWNSSAWLARLDPSVLTPHVADSLVRRRIDEVLGDSAIVPGAAGKPATLRWSVGDARRAATWNPTTRRFERAP